ncbi:hypothetical protein NM688_g2589 [Phlebia brevispora]|uniref:Uncharacterized protein n=1 Tax=Phlebia brevispora TaxID=194682 RepID=A0ACC1T7X0_9APHY|nr:hypothetical protein NM688_g2589 [Phlebia brevispora]
MVAICSALLNKGFCPDISTCQKRHDLPICQDCGIVCPDDKAFQMHLKGKRHRRQLAGQTTLLICPLCRIHLVGQNAWAQHIQTKKHRRLMKQQAILSQVQPVEAGEDVKAHEFCALCQTYVHVDAWAKHPNTKMHRRKLTFGAFEAALDEAAKDKHGITVSPTEINFQVLQPAEAKVGVSLQVEAQGTVPLATVTLVEAKLSSSATRRATPFTIEIVGAERRVVYGRGLKLKLIFRQGSIGAYHDRIEIVFRDTKLNQQFVIARAIKAIVGDPAEYAALQPKAPFVPRKRLVRDPETDVVPGDPPPALNSIKYVVKLDQYPIPPSVSRTLTHTSSLQNIIRQFRASVLPQALDGSTYGRYYKVLLWAEEHRSERDLEIYDISSTILSRSGSYYYLDVPGLAEKRPSVLVGDRIFIQPAGSDVDKGKWFEGCVHVVRRESVGMKLNRAFADAYTPQRLYRARFKLNRVSCSPTASAFPPGQQRIPTTDHVRGRLYNKLIAQNAAQLHAVASIVNLPLGWLTFILFGPPGTGKTVTTVEAILQILLANPKARVFACAPSNSAADLIAQRLKTLTPNEMFRFYAPSRHKNEVPGDLLPYAAINGDGHFTAPPVSRLKQYRVIVSTCVSASFAYGVGMPRGHFTHIFVDEAGQATEPEVMIVIKTMADNNTNVILSGDPRQLGPIIRSPVARELGLEKSYLERVMENPAYDEQRGHGLTVVKLVQNFRSHDAILRFPNERFYGGDLRPCGDRKVINAYIGSSFLPNARFPIIFHASTGKDDREMSSPSFFNAVEAMIIKKYVEDLKANRVVRVADSEIGVITPYHAQSRRIRMILKAVADEVKVGSVEEFQGQERRVILISTVRSSRDFVSFDLRHTLGFVANPRRLNVAVTRAKSLLIIVGDPTVLSLDPLWRSFLNYIYTNGGWKGEAPNWDTDAPVHEDAKYDEEVRELGLADMNRLARRLESVTLEEAADSDDADDADELALVKSDQSETPAVLRPVNFVKIEYRSSYSSDQERLQADGDPPTPGLEGAHWSGIVLGSEQFRSPCYTQHRTSSMGFQGIKYTSIDEIRDVYSQLGQTFKSGATWFLPYRRRQLLQLARLVQDNIAFIEDAYIADLGKPRQECTAVELVPLIQSCLYAAEHLEEWSQPERPKLEEWRRSWDAAICHVPKGLGPGTVRFTCP